MNDARALHRQTRLAWDEAAEAYEQEVAADVEALRDGLQHFGAPEAETVRALCRDCDRAVHLQCAGGRDSLSLWNAGAREVVGVDISPRMIDCARRKAEALGAPATWHCCDLLDTPGELDGTADLVYTGRGALCWMMDLDGWAKVAARLLKPGGALFIYDGHPLTILFDMEADHLRIDPDCGDYFHREPLAEKGWGPTYIGDLGKAEEEHALKYERIHKLADIVNAVIGAGLRLERLGEYPDAYWEEFPNMPEDLRRRFPNTFTLLARKEAAVAPGEAQSPC